MQAKLQANELAYLLHTHGAQAVPGLDAEQFFPAETSARHSLLEAGFTALVEHGWLIAEDAGYHTNTSMMLLSAVVAAPERLLVVTRQLEGGVQILTYSWAQQFVVEMFEADDRNYILTSLESNEAVLESLRVAFHIPATPTRVQPIKLSLKDLAIAFTGTVEEKGQFWRARLVDAPDSNGNHMTECRRLGLLTQFVRVVNQLRPQAGLIIFEDECSKRWGLIERDEMITLYPLTLDILQTFIDTAQ